MGMMIIRIQIADDMFSVFLVKSLSRFFLCKITFDQGDDYQHSDHDAGTLGGPIALARQRHLTIFTIIITIIIIIVTRHTAQCVQGKVEIPPGC